jgi:hypothetical protein
MTPDKPQTVSRSIPRQDGGYWITTRERSHAVSTEDLPEGTRVLIRDGKAERAEGRR